MAEEGAPEQQMESIGLSEVARISSLARLGMTPAELETLAVQLEVIVSAVGQLSRADISTVPATAQVGELRNVTRADVVEKGLGAEEALGNAGVKAAGFLRVPAIQ
ncbi:MAG TPA: Asp-tRNA(Asn)/Glu-tRNA(Gln) amidotransferase subunit GatC [Candidatus Dormibacteraeota bacterium]|nr:Asp-tRNA(Asn)/Glu-tRNA(Gln) amidotransferase subunit GatC [Candidatus Dormibacteraeota bacterium]